MVRFKKLREFLYRQGFNVLTVDELDQLLFQIPTDSELYELILKDIQDKIYKEYKMQHILCIDSNSETANIETKSFDTSLYYTLTDNMSFEMKFEPRFKIEYDYRYRQILTFCYITSKTKDRIVFIKKKDTKKLSLIGGHTDYHIKFYNSAAGDFLKENVYKELFEELKIFDKKSGTFITSKEEIEGTLNPKMYINDKNTPYGLRNVGFLYELKFDVDNLLDRYVFYSNEDEHDVKILTINEIDENQPHHMMIPYAKLSLMG